MNVNGHSPAERCRDYLVELRPHVEDLRSAQRREVLARTRAQDFWGGVYKQFAVTGPAKYWLKIARNDSFNTMVAAVMLDRLAGPERPEEKLFLPGLGGLHYRPPQIPAGLEGTSSSPELRAALLLGTTLEQALLKRGTATSRHPLLVQSLRAARAADARDEVQRRWRWQVPHWTPADRAEFNDMIRRGWEAHVKGNPHVLKAGL